MSASFIESNPQVLNIELGCGCGNFGQLYYPKCFITDRRTKNELTKICTAYHLDFSCAAHKIPSPNDRFEKLIICNPYNYGFRDREDARILLAEFVRVIKHEGSFIIISSNRNPYANQIRISDRIEDFNSANRSKLRILVNNTIDPLAEYSGYTFFDSDRNETSPNFKIEVQCSKM